MKKKNKKKRGMSAAFMRSINPYLKKRKKHSYVIKQKTRTKMAKRRYKKAKVRHSKKSASILGINSKVAIAALIYGAIRAKTSNMLAPYTSRIPLGNVSDEIGMLAVSTLGKKFLFKSAGTIRDALTAGQTIEIARIGDAVASGELGINLFGQTQASNSNGYVFA